MLIFSREPKDNRKKIALPGAACAVVLSRCDGVKLTFFTKQAAARKSAWPECPRDWPFCVQVSTNNLITTTATQSQPHSPPIKLVSTKSLPRGLQDNSAATSCLPCNGTSTPKHINFVTVYKFSYIVLCTLSR